jgi:hypothetical protein
MDTQKDKAIIDRKHYELLCKAMEDKCALLEACKEAYAEFSKPLAYRDHGLAMSLLRNAINQATK